MISIWQMKKQMPKEGGWEMPRVLQPESTEPTLESMVFPSGVRKPGPMSSPEANLYLSFQLHIQWQHFGSLKSVLMGVFTYTTEISKHHKSGLPDPHATC